MIETTVNTSIEQIKEESNRFTRLRSEVSTVIVGQNDIITFIITALLSNGHILLEGVPGVAKTTMIKAVAQALGLSFSRIQFTPDLLPADVVGTLIYNPKTQEFDTKKGPIFANLILADEINRAPAKVQAALLEAMQEGQVTIGLNTYVLPKPFFVFATQNPIEQEGTYPLPEAQLDRFMFKLLVSYPNAEQEKEILKRVAQAVTVQQVLGDQDILDAQARVNSVYVDDKVIDYIVNLVAATRAPEEKQLASIKSYIRYGVSPRATISLKVAAQAYAFLDGRNFVTPDDVKIVAPAIFRHRIVKTYEAEADRVCADTLVRKILNTIPSP